MELTSGMAGPMCCRETHTQAYTHTEWVGGERSSSITLTGHFIKYMCSTQNEVTFSQEQNTLTQDNQNQVHNSDFDWNI